MGASRRYNQRQRKKMRKGEFQELGFAIRAQIDAALSQDEQEAMLDRFVEDAVEANGMLCVSGIHGEFWGWIFSARQYTSVTEEQRATVRTWLAGQSALTAVQVGPQAPDWDPAWLARSAG